METNDIKETWKAGIERTIKPYPEERLNEMIVNSARKSIKTVCIPELFSGSLSLPWPFSSSYHSS